MGKSYAVLVYNPATGKYKRDSVHVSRYNAAGRAERLRNDLVDPIPEGNDLVTIQAL